MSQRDNISFFSVIVFALFCFQTVRSQNNATLTPPVSPPPSAQNFHQWGAVTLFNGLPSDNIHSIIQTPDGVLWFGTDSGLAKFDGRRISTVAISDAGKIFALKTSPDGTLWIGAEKGAFFLDDNKFRLIEETKDVSITSILISDKIRLATDKGLIFTVTMNEKRRPGTVEKIPAEALHGSDEQLLKITSLAPAGERIIAGTRSRSFLLIENEQAFESFGRPRPFFVNALAGDKSGNLWLGADADDAESGLFSLQEINRPQRIGAGLGNVLSIEPDNQGGVWAGTQDNGLFHFRGGGQLEHFTFENTAGGLRSNTIYAIFVDREGVVWIGTNRGVCRFDASSPFNQIFSEKSNSNFVRTLYKSSDGQIFAGTNRGLFVFSGSGWTEIGNFSQKTVYTIAEASARQLLIGTSSGLFSFDDKLKLAGDTRALVNFQGKTYAAVFNRGIVQIENQTQLLTDEAALTFFARPNELWIGTGKQGIFIYDGKNVRQEKNFDVLRGSAIWKITSSGDAGNQDTDLWLATERGLFLFKDGQLQNIIANQDVRDVVANGASVWAATEGGGLVHLRHDEIFGWLMTNLNVEQGLPSQKIFSILPIENRLFIGTNRGIVNYVPSIVAPEIVPTRVLSQRLHEMAELSQIIQLNYPQNSLLVEVAGLSSRTFPEQFQYGFTLKNSKGEILEKKLSNDSQFAPANLVAGEYSIEAIAFNKDLLASAPLIIKFSVARSPFPWTATALGVLLAIALVALIWAVIERRRIAQRNRELAAARFNLANEAERERKRIARDLHDQTLADLRNLMLMSDKLPTETGEFRAEIESVSTEIRRICEDLSPSVLENVGLFAALEFLLSHTIENYKFLAEDSEDELNFPKNAQMQIYRIAQEVLTNIKHHSDAKSVEMKIEVSAGEAFVLDITDDGTAFNPAQTVHKGRGITNIKSRAALIEAEVDWHAAGENGGTTFRLRKTI